MAGILLWFAAATVNDAYRDFFNPPDLSGLIQRYTGTEDSFNKIKDAITEENVNKIDSEEKHFPLHWAAMYGYTNICALLVSKGASVNSINCFGMTPLHAAVWYGNQHVCQLLLEKGADVNIKDTELELTPLHYAAQYCRSAIAKLLVERGADVLAEDKTGMTPLHYAAYGMMRLLNPLPNLQPSQLNNAVKAGSRVMLCKLFLEYGADVNAKEKMNNFTPLHFAAGSSLSVEVIPLLVECGAQVDAEDTEGRTPIDLATIRSVREVLTTAIDNNSTETEAALISMKNALEFSED
jgi:ankyrin repeat protein